METAPEITETVTDSQIEASPLEGAIQESKEAISGAEPIKRGRHKKDCPCEKCAARRANPSIEPPKEKKQEKASGPAIPAEYLKPVVNMPFAALAARTKFEGWNLTEKEKEDNAILLEKCMARYFPQLETAHAEAVGLALGLGFAAYARYLAYSEWKRNQTPAVQANRNASTDVPAAKNQESPGIKPSLALASILDENQTPAL